MKRITIGRNSENDIVVNYPLVSGNHAEIIINDDGIITLIDHSTNGTRVNGQLINNRTINIRRGDNILFAGNSPLDWSQIFKNSTVSMNNMYRTVQINQQEGGNNFQNYSPSQNDIPYTPPPMRMRVVKEQNIGLIFLSFLILIVGLILYFSWKNETPNMAKGVLTWAIVGFVINLIGFSSMM